MKLPILKMARLTAVLCAAMAFAHAAHAEPPLPALNIDLSQTTVSGISSGAFMAAASSIERNTLDRRGAHHLDTW